MLQKFVIGLVRKKPQLLEIVFSFKPANTQDRAMSIVCCTFYSKAMETVQYLSL